MDNKWLPDEQILALMPWLAEIEPIGEPGPHGGLQMQAAEVGPIATAFHCNQDGCTKVYGRKSDLDRHAREEHMGQSSRFLCPVDLCPRSIKGEGFARMCQLTTHLTTKQKDHNMDKTRAKYEARKANPQKNGAKKE